MKKIVLFIFAFILLLLSKNSEAQNWELQSQLGSSDQKPADNLGISVDISDSLMIAGAWLAESEANITSEGAAYIYKKQEDGSWLEQIKLTSPHPEHLGYFGFRVAICGNSALVGAFNEDRNGFGNTGRVYTYFNDPAQGWILTDSLFIPNPHNVDYFGYDIAMMEDYAIIGAYRHPFDENGGNSIEEAGATFIVERGEDHSWEIINKLVAPDREADDHFGRHVAIDNNGIMISAVNKESSTSISEAGVVYGIYCEELCELKNISAGDLMKIESSDPNFFERFGWDVAISGKWAAIGKPSKAEHPDGTTAGRIGAVYFFKWEGGNWKEKQVVFASDFEGQANFGERISIDGSVCVIGAGGEMKDENGDNILVRAGAAYVFELNEDGLWQEVQKLIGQNRAFGDLFANEGLSLDKDQIVVGAWLADTLNGEYLIDGGAVQVYKRSGQLPSSNVEIQNDRKVLLLENPSSGFLRIEFGESSNEPFQGKIVIYDLRGILIRQEDVRISNQYMVDLFELPAATYFVKLFNAKEHIILKWIKL